jgi:hypothetical protein
VRIGWSFYFGFGFWLRLRSASGGWYGLFSFFSGLALGLLIGEDWLVFLFWLRLLASATLSQRGVVWAFFLF